MLIPGLPATFYFCFMRYTLLLSLLLGAVSVKAQITGNWKDEKSGGVINVYMEGNKYFGVAVSGGNEQDKEALKGKKVMILKDFSKKTARSWCCGTVYEPWKKITADGKLELVNDSTLKVTGTYLIFSETHIWKRL